MLYFVYMWIQRSFVLSHLCLIVLIRTRERKKFQGQQSFCGQKAAWQCNDISDLYLSAFYSKLSFLLSINSWHFCKSVVQRQSMSIMMIWRQQGWESFLPHQERSHSLLALSNDCVRFKFLLNTFWADALWLPQYPFHEFRISFSAAWHYNQE